MWTDSHCHLDAAEFDPDRADVFARARAAGVTQFVVPAVTPGLFHAAAILAHTQKCAYALGIHPLWMDRARQDAGNDLAALDAVRQALEQAISDPHLVAVGEIGLDFFVPGLDPDRQWFFYRGQLALAAEFGLPVIVHVRKSADMLLKGLRQVPVPGGIAHAFNGSAPQAQAFLQRGFRLGFGGAATYERAHRIRQLAQTLPLDALVLETDAPDMPPDWIYRTAAERAQGQPQGRNEPAELPRIGQVVAELRGITPETLAHSATRNTYAALPRLVSCPSA